MKHPEPGLSTTKLALASAFLALLINVATSNDYCFGAFLPTVITVAAVSVIDAVARRVRPSIGRGLRGRVMMGIAVACLMGFGIRLSADRAFRSVFDCARPSSVEVTYVERWGPGWDHVLLMQFRADRSTLEELLRHRSFEQDPDSLHTWDQVFRGTKTLWKHVFDGLFPSDHTWQQLPAPENPMIYRGGNEITPRIRLIWDPDTEWTYVMYSFG